MQSGDLHVRVEAVAQGSSILILSDRGVSADRASVPMLLAVGAVVEALIKKGVGNKAEYNDG